jgi:hypothetical protein
MKKLSNLIFPVLLVCAFAQATAQVVVDNAPWCPAGATWIYRTFSAASNTYLKFSYEKDTVINNINAKKLGVESIQYIGMQLGEGRIAGRVGEEFLAERNDSIFWLNLNSNNFEFIYSFSAVVGEGFEVRNERAACPTNPNYPLSDTIFVDSIFVDTFNNRSFQVLRTSYDRGYTLGAIFSKIGPSLCPFPEINNMYCNWPTTEYGNFYEDLLCYSDSIRGQMQFWNINDFDGECHYIETFVSKLEFDNYYSIYPNPTNGMINIANTNSLPVSEVRIYSINGVEMFAIADPNITDLNVSALPAGLYIAKLSNAENKISIFKFVKY